MNAAICPPRVARLYSLLAYGLSIFVIVFNFASGTTPPLSSGSEADDLALIFRPFETNSMTMSPDGLHLAYTERKGDDLYLVLRNLADNSAKRLLVGTADVGVATGAREKTPANVTFLRWGAGNRLVFNFNAQNVWSIAADGSDPERLGDIRTFAPDLDPPKEVIVGGGIVIVPPDPLQGLRAMDQPITVTAMDRGDKYAYVEAKMEHLGRAPEIGASGKLQLTPMPEGTPRVVLQVDIATGKQKEWASAPDSAFALCDQAGHPRIVLRQDNIKNSNSLHQLYCYAPAKSDAWKPLDAQLKSDPSLRFQVGPELQLGERSVPLGFGYDPNVLYYASNVGRDTFGIYAIDTRTWQRTPVAVETNVSDFINPLANQPSGDTLVLDHWQKKLVGIRYVGAEPATLWLDPGLERVQRTLNDVDKSRRWEIREWSESRDTFLVLATGYVDPGTYYIFHAEERSLDEVMKRASWLPQSGCNPGRSFGFQTKEGVNLSGYLTAPWRSLLKRPPLVVLCHDGPWDRDEPGYNREVQALASMGFMVLQVNYRGSAGFGQKHLNALRDGYDAVAIDDILAAIEAITPKNVDRRFVAIMGRGYGGYLALRAMQLHPKVFRCGIAIDAPTDLPTWVDTTSARSFAGEMRRAFFGSDRPKLSAISPLTHPDQIDAPVLLMQSDNDQVGRSDDLARALKGLKKDVTYLRLNTDEAADRPKARAALFRKIRGFLNTNIYDYAVKIGALEEKS